MQSIRFEGVSKVYEDANQAAVKDISFEVEAGKLVVLLGPSGCGKTTLLKMVNRLYEPTSGNIFLDDLNIRNIEVIQLRRQIGYVIQQVGLFPHMTVAENIALVPTLLNWSKEKIDDRIDSLLQMTNLDPGEFRNRYPAQLSGGQQQRVGLARALAGDPGVLLMDEPFGAIDAITRTSLQNEVMTLQTQLKKTILFVTHDVEEALLLADKIVILRSGELVQYDTPWHLLSTPVNDFVNELLNANDRIRQLGILKARDVMTEFYEKETSGLRIVNKNTKLRNVLSILLTENYSFVAVADDNERIVGKITFDNLRMR